MRNLLSGVLYQITPLGIYAGATPVILSIFGSDSFAQFSVFMLIQGLFVLAELGLGAAVIREGSNFKHLEDPVESTRIYSVIKSIEAIFILIFIVASAFFIGLNPINLFYNMEHQISIWIALAASMRFITIPYRSFLISQEKHIRLSLTNLTWSLTKYLIALYGSHQLSDFKYFFVTFCIVSLIEGYYYKIIFDTELSKNSRSPLGLIHFSPLALRPVFSYSLWIAYSTLLWVLVAQIDRLIISLKVDLYLFSAYFLTSTAAAALLYISGPISQILLPRWSNDRTSEVEMLGAYRFAFHLISLLYLLVTFILLFSPNVLFMFWTQDTFVAKFAETHLVLFLIVNYFSAVGSLMNNILLAKKETHYQAKGSTVSALLQSLIVMISLHYGNVFEMLVCLALFRFIWFIIWSQFIFQTLLAVNFLKLIRLTVVEIILFALMFIIFLNVIKPTLSVVQSFVIFTLCLSVLSVRISQVSVNQIGKLKW